MRKFITLLCFIIFYSLSYGQSADPLFTSWILNTTGVTGYNGLPANVQKIQYSQKYVYIGCSGIPAYSIGPWPHDPNAAAEQDFEFKLPRSPQEETSSKLSTPLGPEGVLINGVAMFNSKDANSYNNQDVWHSNAVVVEASSFDSCLGHPQAIGIYHHHQNPVCLYNMDPTKHSPIIGYAFDGYPVYGAYGYANPDGTGGIKRMRSSYRLRNITQRTSLPDGTRLSPSQYGPDVSAQYPLGYYIEDYEYVDSLGDLDQYNGRFTVTPEYPNGIYAYFATVDSAGHSAYPYLIGPKYYGHVVEENIQMHDHVTINEPVNDYNPTTGIGPNASSTISVYSLSQNYPNPFNPSTIIRYNLKIGGHVTMKIYDIEGNKISTLINSYQNAGNHEVEFNAGSNGKFNRLSSGVYFYRLQVNGFSQTKKLVYMR